jgi:hypothetical protein
MIRRIKQCPHFVAGDNDRNALCGKRRECSRQVFGVFGRNASIRFVREQAEWSSYESSGELRAPPLTTGEFEGTLIQMSRDSHQIRRFDNISTAELTANHLELIPHSECCR